MAYLLAIESATKVCSVALFQDRKLIGLKEEGGDYSHAENLAVFVDGLLKQCKLDPKDLSAVAVSKGPGSYTGLRIGVSLAKGLCYALQIPLIGLDTLSCMASGFIHKRQVRNALVCPMIDARRMEVYAAIYDAKLGTVKPLSADIIEEESYATYLKKNRIYFIGDGASKTEKVITNGNAVFLATELPSAANMGVLAMDRFEAGEFEDVAYFEPFYLKEFIAVKSKSWYKKSQLIITQLSLFLIL